jgi:hypothetical protein
MAVLVAVAVVAVVAVAYDFQFPQLLSHLSVLPP